jgi:hypothetical protein
MLLFFNKGSALLASFKFPLLRVGPLRAVGEHVMEHVAAVRVR